MWCATSDACCARWITAGHVKRLTSSRWIWRPCKSRWQAINVGLESFAENLAAQEAPVLHVDWRPPAGGNERLMAILERMKK